VLGRKDLGFQISNKRKNSVRIQIFIAVLVAVLLVLALWTTYSIGFSDGAAAESVGNLGSEQIAVLPSKFLNVPSYSKAMGRQGEASTELLKQLIKQERDHYNQIAKVLQVPSSK
jgi:hypothetical protein